MKEALNVPQFRSELKEKKPIDFEVPSWSAAHFQDDIREKKITISPAEQIRYEQNAKLADVVTKELAWLVDVEDVTAADLEAKFKSFKGELSSAQMQLITKIKNRLVEAARETEKISQGSAQKLYQKLVDEFHYPPADSIDIHPLGMIVVKSSNWNLMHLDTAGFSYEPTEAYKQRLDPKALGFMQRLVVLRDDIEGKSELSQDVIRRHETFHYLYNMAIRPESTANYKFDLEKRYFLQVKNEILAHLLGNDWQWDAKKLLSDLKPKQKRISDFDDRSIDDVILHVYQKICREIGSNLTEAEYKKETEGYPDALFLCLREIARLYCMESRDFEDAIKAVLTAQDFKEMTEKLKQIDKEKVFVWRDRLPVLLALSPKESAHKIINYSTLQRDFRLNFKRDTAEVKEDWQWFYSQVADHIKKLKQNPDDEENTIAVNELSSLLRSFGIEVED
ncbi:MAG: hypothetical protein WCT54_02350 [Patescibacteria group bacterium]